MIDNLMDLLKLHEGVRNKPYKDTVGKTTIGVGRNLTDRGLRDKEVAYLLANDIEEVTQELRQRLPWTEKLDPVRKTVLQDMLFNMGWPVLSQFKNTLGFIERDEYEKAAVAMLQSKWATQVGNRAKRLAKMMQFGQWPTE